MAGHGFSLHVNSEIEISVMGLLNSLTPTKISKILQDLSTRSHERVAYHRIS